MTAVIFPFDAFGNAGTAAGAERLGDVVREILDDLEEETRPSRQDALRGRVDVVEERFDDVSSLTKWRETGKKLFRETDAKGEFTLWLSGNHLGVLPVYESLTPKDLVVQLDAHLDCYHLHDTHEGLSHGNFLRFIEKGPKVVNVGHRDLFLAEVDIKRHFAACLPAGEVSALKRWTAKAERVWIDLDVDAIDPAFCPGVLDPLPCGLTPREVLAVFGACWGPKLAGVSISEFCPARDERDRSLELLGWLVEWVLLRAAGDAERSTV